MLVIVKSSPDTPEGKRGVKLAGDMGADLCLIQNAVYFAQTVEIKGFVGRVFILAEDMRLRGLNKEGLKKDAKRLSYKGLIDLMTEHEKVIGMF